MKLNDNPDPRLVSPIDTVFHEPNYNAPPLLHPAWDKAHMDMRISSPYGLLYAIFGGCF